VDATVAGLRRGTIPAGSADRSLDATADVSVDELDPAGFDAIVIPGGGGPANLEKSPRAVEIARAFLADETKLTAAICHGPRLLAHTGLLRGRATTCLASVKDELPQLWNDGSFGTYVDRAVVTDRNLITSRYPNDAAAFTRAIAQRLVPGAVRGLGRGRLLLVDGGARPLNSGLVGAGAIAGLEVRTGGDGLLAQAGPADVVVVLPGEKLATFFPKPELATALQSAVDAGRVMAVGDAGDTVPRAARVALASRHETIARVVAWAGDRVAAPPASAPAARPVAAIAVRGGFDDRVVAAMDAALAARGFEVVYVSSGRGWVRGKAGVPAEATLAFADPIDAAVVVAPGHWGTADAEADAAYRAWLVARLSRPLIAFGWDAHLLGNGDDRFAGQKFASTDQAVWSFKRGGAGYVDDPAVLSNSRLLTAKGDIALPAVLNRLDALLSSPVADHPR
jgi:protease I